MPDTPSVGDMSATTLTPCFIYNNISSSLEKPDGVTMFLSCVQHFTSAKRSTDNKISSINIATGGEALENPGIERSHHALWKPYVVLCSQLHFVRDVLQFFAVLLVVGTQICLQAWKCHQ